MPISDAPFPRFSVLRLALWTLAALVGTVGPSCSPDPKWECRPRAERECLGEDECPGVQICGGEPTSWGECSCVGPGKIRPSAGQACKADADCAKGESCLWKESDAFLGGFPARGLCAAECTKDPSVCDEYVGEVECVQTAGQETEQKKDDRSFCLLGCRLGDNDATKCLGRADLACDDSVGESGAAVCRPLCLTDDDCGKRHCDLGTGVCTEEPLDGAAFGAACTSTELTCGGLCLIAPSEQNPDYAFCSHRCSIGSQDICAYDESGEPAGYCQLLGAVNSRLGDSGFCAPLCNCDEDCAHPEAACVLDDAVEAATGQLGICLAVGDFARAPACSAEDDDEMESTQSDAGDVVGSDAG